jgi:hypothetical protein
VFYYGLLKTSLPRASIQNQFFWVPMSRSHWSVDSAATVKLITNAVGATTRDKTLGRAEALRRAMLAMIDHGNLQEAHPAYRRPKLARSGGARDHCRRT